MTENIPQTSASARIEAAQKALARFEARPASIYGTGWGTADDMADAIRALITPPSVSESVEQIAARVIHSVPFRTDLIGDHVCLAEGMLSDLAVAAVHAGIQSAHETWEPADVPSQEQMLRWLGIEYTESAEFGYVYIPLQQIEREEI